MDTTSQQKTFRELKAVDLIELICELAQRIAGVIWLFFAGKVTSAPTARQPALMDSQ